MRRPEDRRLWVIDPSVSRPEDQGVAHIVEGWTGPTRLFRPALRPGDGPTPAAGYDTDGIVLMGSASSVHDYPGWLEELKGWLQPVLEGDVDLPLLGICFGHQLVAHGAGGEVGFMRPDRSKRLAVEDAELDGGRLLPGRRTLRVVASHSEEVKTCPPGYRVVARRPGVPIDGMEHRDRPIFSFQFHPEAGEEFALHVGIPVEGLDARVHDDSRRVLEAFRARVLGN